MRRRARVAWMLLALAPGCGSMASNIDDDTSSGADGAAPEDARSGVPDATTADAADGRVADAADSAAAEVEAQADAQAEPADGAGDAAKDAGSGADAGNGTTESGTPVEDATVGDAAAATDAASAHDALDDVEDASAIDAREDATVADARDDVEEATGADAPADVEDATVEDATVPDAGSSGDATAKDAAPESAAGDTGTGGTDAGAEGGSCAVGASLTGGLTNYTQTAANACGQPWPDAWSVDTSFPAVAMNTALFDEGSAVSACNKCVLVTGTTGATATFVVVDQCPGFSNTMWCQSNHLDIDGLTSYNLVENGAPGSIDNSPGVPIAGEPGPVTWKYVPCPFTAGITYLFQPSGLSGGTYFYLALNVYHTKYGLQTVRYRSGGVWVDLQPRTDDQLGTIDGNFVINGVAVPNPIDLQVVDEYGQIIEDDGVSWSGPTSTVQSSKQFPTCN